MASYLWDVDLDLQRNQLINARIENRTTAPAAHAEGLIYYDSLVGQKRIKLCVDDTTPTYVSLPRLDLDETVAGLWNFAPASSTMPFTVPATHTVKVTNLNADYLDGRHGTDLPTALTYALRQSDGTIRAADPVNADELATKNYVDSTRQEQDQKDEVWAATTINVNLSSMSASIDGRTMSNGDRFLARAQTDASENGIYIYNGSGSAATRAPDADESSEVTSGMTVFVISGTEHQGAVYTLTTANPITLDTTDLTFTQTGGQSIFDAGNGIVKVGNQFHFITDSNYAIGDIPYAATATTMAFLGAGATGTVLKGQGAGVAPIFGAVSLTADVSGVLPVGSGGTGTSTNFTPGAVIFMGGSNAYAQDVNNLKWDDGNNRLAINWSGTPYGGLHVQNSGVLSTAGGGLTGIADITGFSGLLGAFLGDDSTYGGGLLQVKNAGNRGTRGHASGSPLVDFSFSDEVAFHINKDGSIGVWTDTPGPYPMHISMGSTFTAVDATFDSVTALAIDGSSPYISFRAVDGIGYSGLAFGGNGESDFSTFRHIALSATTGQYEWRVAGAHRMTLDHDGNLGLATSTTNPERYLDIIRSGDGEYAQFGKTGDAIALGVNAWGNYLELRASSKFRVYSGSDHEDYWEIDENGDVRLSDQNTLYWMDDDTSHGVGFRAPATVAANVQWTLPGADAVFPNSALISNAAGILTWKEILTQDSAIQSSMRLTGGFARLDATDDYFHRADADILSLTSTLYGDHALSLVAFVKLNSISEGGIIGKRGNATATELEYDLAINSSGKLQLRLWDNAGGTVQVESDADMSAYVGQWIWVAGVCDPTSAVGDRENDLTLYVNGELVAQTQSETGTYAGMTAGVAPLEIGRVNESEYFDGAISGVGLYNAALTQGQVNELVKDAQPLLGHRWAGSHGDILNQTAWSSHGWSSNHSPTLAGGGDHDGQTDVLHVTADQANEGIYRAGLLPVGRYVQVEARVKVISGAVSFEDNSASRVYFTANTTNASSWTSFRGVVLVESGPLTIYADTASAEFYIDNVVVTQVGCLGWWSQSTLHPGGWRDNSTNGLNLTANGSPDVVPSFTHFRVDQPVADTTEHAFEVANAGTVKFAVDGRGRGAIGSDTISAAFKVQAEIDTIFGGQAPNVTDCMLSLQNNTSSEIANSQSQIQFGINGGTYNRVGSFGMVAESASTRMTHFVWCLDDGGARSEKMRLTEDGWLGLKINTPRAILHVYDGNSGITPDGSADQFMIETNGTGGMTIASGPTGNGEIFFADTFSATIGRIRYHHNGDEMSFWAGGAELMRILSTGYVRGLTGFQSDEYRGHAFTTSFLKFNDDQTLNNDMTTLASQGRMNFIIDAVNNSTDKQFRWWTDSGDVDSATLLMTLDEDGLLDLDGKLRTDLVESKSYPSHSFLHFKDPNVAAVDRVTLSSIGGVSMILDSNDNGTTEAFRLFKNNVDTDLADQVFSISEGGEAKLTMDVASSKTAFWIDQTAASSGDILLKLTTISSENGSRAISFEADTADEKFIVWADGTVSIGSDTPLGEQNRLHVFRPTGTSSLVVGSGDGSGATLVLDGNANGDSAGGDYAGFNHNSAGELEIYNNQLQPIDFTINGQNVMRLKGDRSVSVGRHGGTWPLDVYSSWTAFMFRLVHDADGNQGPVMRLEHDTDSQAAGDSIGEIEFYGHNSAGGDEETAHIRVSVQEVGAGYLDSDFIFRTYRGGSAYDVFTISHDRRIGVNQISPSTVFELVNPESAETPPVMISATSTGDASIQYNIDGVFNWTGGVDNSDGDKFKFSPGSALSVSPVMTLMSSGLVGVNVATPTRPFHVQANTTGDYGVALFENIEASGGSIVSIDRTGTARVARLDFSTAGTTNWMTGLLRYAGSPTYRYAITTNSDMFTTAPEFCVHSGKIGLNEANPDYRLHLTGDDFAGSSIKLERTDAGSGNAPGIIMSANTTAAANVDMGGIWFLNTIGADYSALIRARTVDAAGEKGRIEFVAGDGVGNGTAATAVVDEHGIGIGQTDPVERLHIGDNLTLFDFADEKAVFAQNAWYDAGQWKRMDQSNDSWQVQLDGTSGTSKFQIYRAAPEAQYDISAWTRTFVIEGGATADSIYVNGTGVGILNSSPSYALDVTGSVHTTGNLIADGGVSLGGYLWHSYTSTTAGSGIGNGFALTFNSSHGTTPNVNYHYVVMLTCNGTGTTTGARYTVYYDGTNWYAHLVSRRGSTSNHPLLDVTTAGVATVYNNHATGYTIRVSVESYLVGDDHGVPHSLGSDFMWTRDNAVLSYAAGSVLVGNGTADEQFTVRNNDGNDVVVLVRNDATGDSKLQLSRQSTGYESSIEFLDGGNLDWTVGTVGNNNFAIREDGSTNRFVVETGGNIGVNVSDPIARMHVVETAEETAFRVEGASNGFVMVARGGTDYSVAMRGRVTIGNAYASETGPDDGLLVLGKVGFGVTDVNALYNFQVAGAIGITQGTRTRYALRHTNWGYSTSYRALVIGSAGTTYNENFAGSITPFFGYDPSINADSNFNGGGLEVGFRNEVRFITPNSTDDGWLFPFTMKDGKCGILNTNPSVELDVTGSFNVSGNATIGSGSEDDIDLLGNIRIGGNDGLPGFFGNAGMLLTRGRSNSQTLPIASFDKVGDGGIILDGRINNSVEFQFSGSGQNSFLNSSFTVGQNSHESGYTFAANGTSYLKGNVRVDGRIGFDSGKYYSRVFNVPSPGSSSGPVKCYIRLQPVTTSAIVQGRMTFGAGWNYANSTGRLEFDFAYHCTGVVLNSAVNYTRMVGHHGLMANTIRVGELEEENGYVSIPIWLSNTNSIFIRFDYWGSNGDSLTGIAATSWATDTLPSNRGYEVKSFIDSSSYIHQTRPDGANYADGTIAGVSNAFHTFELDYSSEEAGFMAMHRYHISGGTYARYGSFGMINPASNDQQGDFVWQLTDAGGTVSEVMRVTGGGRLGVNTTTPDATAHFVGDEGVKISDAAESSNAILVPGSNGLEIQNGSGVLMVGFDHTNQHVGFGTNAPTNRIQIEGSNNVDCSIRFNQTNPAPDNEWRLTAESSDQTFRFKANEGAKTVLVLSDDGAIGAGGISAPTWGFQVNNSATWSATGTCKIHAGLNGSGIGLQVSADTRTSADDAVSAFEVIDRHSDLPFLVRVDGEVRLNKLTANKVLGLTANKGITTSVTTDNLSVGSTNLYFTNSLARGALSSNSSAEIAYNSGTGVIGLGTEACRIKTGTIGDGVSTSIQFTHNLGTKGVLVQVIENSGAGREIRVQPERTNVNYITLKFNDAPSTDEFLVIVAAPNG